MPAMGRVSSPSRSLTSGPRNTPFRFLNYANDNDQGLTTFSGSTPVTIGNLPGMAGPNTYGEFATGTFISTGPTETFNWNGAGSAFTVVGAISVVDISAVIHVLPGLAVYQECDNRVTA